MQIYHMYILQRNIVFISTKIWSNIETIKMHQYLYFSALIFDNELHVSYFSSKPF